MRRRKEDLSGEWPLEGCSTIEFEGERRPSVGRIALLARLGRGGTGFVYYGINPRPRTEVAVKILPRRMQREVLDDARFPAERSATMTAAALSVRLALGADPKGETVEKGVKICLELPAWNTGNGSIDFYYWYYGTAALYQVGGKEWKKWSDALLKAVHDAQHGAGTGSRAGSWDAADPWAADGGRIYSTAMMTLCLAHAYRAASLDR